MNKQADGKEFGKILSITAEVHGKELSKIVVGVYFETLKEFTIDEVSSAFNKHLREAKYFPKPSEIIDIIKGIDGSIDGQAMIQASIVWNAIGRIGHGSSIQFKDPVTTAVINQAFGGWIKLASEMVDREHKWFMKDFTKFYETYARAGIKQEGKLLGWHDIDNRAKGYDTESDPVLIGFDNVIKHLEQQEGAA